MKKIIILLNITVASLLLCVTVSGQSPSTILFSGDISDIENNPIAEKEFTTNIIFSSSETEIVSFKEETSSNINGEFLLVLNDLPELFTKEMENQKIDILITLVSDEDWLDEEEFSVKYSFEKQMIEDPEANNDSKKVLFEINRFEGQKLSSLNTNTLFKFTDAYPFAYLKSEFFVSFSEDITDPDSIIIPLLKEEHQQQKAKDISTPAKSRGLKSGYAVGGYNKKK